MVIECAHCQARFKLADDKLKTEGTKVRCSKCKEIFTVFPPAVTTPTPTPTPTPAAAAVPAQPAVSADQIDFGEISFGTTPAPVEETSRIAPPPPPSAFSGAGASFEMEDIAQSGANGFPSADPGATMVIPAGGGVTAAFAAPAPEPEGAFGDFNFDNAPGITLSTPSTSEGPAFGDFDFGETTSAASPPPAAAAAHDPFAFGETTGGDFDFGTSDPAPAAATATPGGGAREDFDFSGMSFGDENATQVFQAPRPAPAQAPPPAAQPPMTATPATAPRSPAERRPRPLPSAIPVPRRRSQNLGGTLLRIASYLLVTALVVVAGAAIYYYQKPGRFDTRKLISELINRSAAPPEESGQIRLANLAGNFLAGTAAGDLFVIRGDATNEFKKPRSAIAVNGILFDKQGRKLRQQIAFCGNPLSDATLRTATFKQLEDAMANQLGASLANFEVPPGKAIPFTVVFQAPPAELTEFTVELVESQGAPPPK